MPELPFQMPELHFQMPVLPFQMPELPFHMLDRVSTGLENPGKSFNWRKNSRTGKSLNISRSP
jgi:hypothetical protein